MKSEKQKQKKQKRRRRNKHWINNNLLIVIFTRNWDDKNVLSGRKYNSLQTQIWLLMTQTVNKNNN